MYINPNYGASFALFVPIHTNILVLKGKMVKTILNNFQEISIIPGKSLPNYGPLIAYLTHVQFLQRLLLNSGSQTFPLSPLARGAHTHITLGQVS